MLSNEELALLERQKDHFNEYPDGAHITALISQARQANALQREVGRLKDDLGDWKIGYAQGARAALELAAEELDAGVKGDCEYKNAMRETLAEELRARASEINATRGEVRLRPIAGGLLDRYEIARLLEWKLNKAAVSTASVSI